MVDFEKIGDTFEDGFDKVKDFTKKNKVLTIAICGVGAFALFKLYTDKTTSEDTEYVSTYAYVPTAYDGYPTMSESVSFDDVVNQLRTETSDINSDFYNEIMSDVTKVVEDMQYENDKKYNNIINSNSGYNENLTTMSYLEEQRIIAEMRANSEAWHNASDTEKARLEAENKQLGSQLGANFDATSGTWSKDGESLYNVSVKNHTNTSTANLTNAGITESEASRSEIISQMKANSEAWHNASDTEKAKLEAENKQLGSQLGANFDATSGTWSDSSGSKLYSVNTSKSSGSSGSNKSSGGSSSSNKSSSSSSGSSGSVGSKMNGGTVAYVGTSSTGEKVYYDKSGNTLGRG